MSDKALENAIARRDHLAAEINTHQQRLDELRRDLARTDAFISDWHTFAGVPRDGVLSVDPLMTGGAVRVSGPRRGVRTNSRKEEVARQARELIRERGEPIGRSELYKLLTQERGLTIQGSDPEMVLSTMLWRLKDQVVRLPDGYWPTEDPHPPSGYDPNVRGDLMAAGLEGGVTPTPEQIAEAG